MHVLYLTFFFPPYNTMGAVRTGKTAKYLEKMGHRVTVISAAPQAFAASLPLEIPAGHVTRTKWLGHPRRRRDTVASERSETCRSRRGEAFARRAYREVMVPDEQVGWYPYACRAACRMMKPGDADIILASAGPFTSLLVARTVARRRGLPWVAELRDPWMDNPYRQSSAIRDALERRLERSTLESASALITVSPAWAGLLSAKFGRPVDVVYNGYEPLSGDPPRGSPDARLLIRYTGSLYGDKRVPAGLFRCLGRLRGRGLPVVVEFYGRQLDGVRQAAARLDVEDMVHCYAEVPYDHSLHLQREADVLLLTMSASVPGEEQVLTGKIYEYLSARRPVLVIGCPDGAAADLVRTAQCGVVIEDDTQLLRQLEEWRVVKAEAGAIGPTPPPPEQFTRAAQTRKLATVLAAVLEKH